jgi:hypothetical protein
MESTEIDGNIPQDEVLTLQENYDNIFLSITRED